MTISIGPVLNLRSTDSQKWNVSIVVGFNEQEDLELEINAIEAEITGRETLLTGFAKTVVRFDLEIVLQDASQSISYGFGQETWQFNVPAKTQRPKMAFVSCNGFSSGKEAKKVDDKFALWRRLTNTNANEPYNIMIMGGDQVYADEIWTKCREIEKWSEKEISVRRKAAFTTKMKEQVDKFYFQLYCSRWMQEPLRTALASIPTTMMWDDHDIFDGWGSYEEEDQKCDVYQGIFDTAQKYFRVFQQQVNADDSEKHPSNVGGSGFSNLHEVHKVAILTLDARSQRTQKQVISWQDWDAIFSKLDGLKPEAFEHVFVVAPVPVVYADFGLIEKLGGWFIKKAHLEDDIRDHWQNPDHRVERLRLIHRLFNAAEKLNARISILSGDVHVACAGQVQKQTEDGSILTIDQLTSSGIVHPAPPGLMGWLLNQLSNDEEVVDQGIVAKMNEFPSLRQKFILDRNYLSIEPDKKGRVWANWNVEDIEGYVSRVIQPVKARPESDSDVIG